MLKRSFRMSIQINILSSPVGVQCVTDYNYNISNQEEQDTVSQEPVNQF